jgi:hypothetical protein
VSVRHLHHTQGSFQRVKAEIDTETSQRLLGLVSVKRHFPAQKVLGLQPT